MKQPIRVLEGDCLMTGDLRGKTTVVAGATLGVGTAIQQ